MRSFSIIVGVVGLAVACGAQVVSPSPVCMGFNDTAFPASPPGVAVSGAGLLWHFTSASTVTIDRIDLWSPGFQPNTYFAVDVIPTAALGGPLAGPPIGTYAYPSPGFVAVPAGWVFATATTAAILTAGSTYALNIRAFPNPPPWCFTASYDPAGPVQNPYQLAAGCATTVPPSGLMGLIARLRGPSCGPGPPASVLGSPSQPTCQGPVFYCPPNLSSYTPPVLGLTNWPLTLSMNSVQGLNAYVFWSTGVNTAGSPIGSSGCLYYLDPVSLTAYMQMGLEPLFAVSAAPQTTTFTLSIPASPAFAGFIVGFQALLVSPTALAFPIACPLNGGFFGVPTNALQVTLGY